MKPWDETEARALLAQGVSYSRLASLYGSTTTTVRCWLDPIYAAERRQRTNAARHLRRMDSGRIVPLVRLVEPRAPSADAAARLAEIPRDTRSLTGRIFGDPLPGRSAFDRARAE